MASTWNVGVLGSGIVGQTLGAGFLKHGHKVMMGTRDPKAGSVQKWISQTPGATAGTFAEAAGFGDVIVFAVLGRVAEDVIRLAGADAFAGKAVIDTMNPIADDPPVKGILKYTTGPNESIGEKLQGLLPTANIVKAFNSVGSALMVNPHFAEGTPTMFLCGDDEGAKARVGEICRQFGWDPYDCGSIISSRALEPLCMLWCLPGFLRNEWTHAFRLLRQ